MGTTSAELPFEDAAAPAFLKLDGKAHGLGLDRGGEVKRAEFVLRDRPFDADVLPRRVLRGTPLRLPRRRQTAVAILPVVEPVHRNALELLNLAELAHHPFGRALVVPERVARNGLIVGRLWQHAVARGRDAVARVAERGRELEVEAGAVNLRCDGEPSLHLARSAVAPRKIRHKLEHCILHTARAQTATHGGGLNGEGRIDVSEDFEILFHPGAVLEDEDIARLTSKDDLSFLTSANRHAEEMATKMLKDNKDVEI